MRSNCFNNFFSSSFPFCLFHSNRKYIYVYILYYYIQNKIYRERFKAVIGLYLFVFLCNRFAWPIFILNENKTTTKRARKILCDDNNKMEWNWIVNIPTRDVHGKIRFKAKRTRVGFRSFFGYSNYPRTPSASTTTKIEKENPASTDSKFKFNSKSTSSNVWLSVIRGVTCENLLMI